MFSENLRNIRFKENNNLKHSTESNDSRLNIMSTISNRMANYYKFTTARIHKPKTNQAYGTSVGVYKNRFWGEPTDVLGYYATKEDLEKEIVAIYQAIVEGYSAYELQYASGVDNKLFLA